MPRVSASCNARAKFNGSEHLAANKNIPFPVGRVEASPHIATVPKIKLKNIERVELASTRRSSTFILASVFCQQFLWKEFSVPYHKHTDISLRIGLGPTISNDATQSSPCGLSKQPSKHQQSHVLPTPKVDCAQRSKNVGTDNPPGAKLNARFARFSL